MFLPDPGNFWVALHIAEDGDKVVIWDQGTFETIRPLFVEVSVRSNVKFLLWSWGFTKYITSVSAADNVVIDGCICIEDAGWILVDVQCIRVIKGMSLARPGRSIICEPYLFGDRSVRLNKIGPHKVENSLTLLWWTGIIEHILSPVLVQLNPLYLFPFIPVILFY